MVRLARFVLTMATALLLALPVLLGPAMPVAVAFLADVATEHHCACGMQAGRCGCPECEDDARRLDRPSTPVVRRLSCNDERFLTGAVPPMMLPSGALPLVAPVSQMVDVSQAAMDPASAVLEPPCPPPRARAS